MSIEDFKRYIQKKVLPDKMVVININVSTGGRVILCEEYLRKLVDDLAAEVEQKTRPDGEDGGQNERERGR